MSFLGRLVVYLEGNIANFESAMGRAEYLANQSSKKIEASIKAADAALIGFASEATRQGIQAIAASMEAAYNNTVKLAASLDDMAEKTGGSVEQLSAFVNVAKVGGHDVGALEVGLTKLAKGMAGADDETKGAGKALEFLGVKAKDSAGNLRATDEVMADVAKALSTYADGAGKTAIAQEMFGKSGAQLLPFLKDMAEMGGQVGRITAEQAARAEEYEKALNRLALAKQQVTQAVVLEMLPAITAVVEVLYKTHQQSQAASGSLTSLAQNGSVRGWAEETALALAQFVDYVKLTAASITAIGESVKVVFADMKVAAVALSFNPEAIASALNERNATLDKAGKVWADLLNRDVNATRKSVEDQLRLQNLLRDAAAGKFDDARDRMARGAGKPTLNWSSAKADPVKESKDLADAQRVLNEIRGKALGIDSAYFGQFEKLTKAYQAGLLPLDEYRAAVQDLLMQHTAYGKAASLAQDAHEKTKDAYLKNLAAARAMVEGMEFEVDMLGKSNTEREISIHLRELERRGIVQGSEDYNELAARIRAAVEARERFGQQMSMWDELGNRAVGFAQALTGGVGNAFKYLVNEAKRFGAELLAIFVKRYVLNLGAELTGNGALSVAAGQVGQGSLAGSILGNAGGYLASGASALGFSGASQFIGGATGAIAGPALPGSALAAGQSVGGFISMAGPYIAAAVAAYMLYNAFRDKGENWKGRLGYGSGAQAYTTNGVFGMEGFQYLAGDDSTNRVIQAFMASTKPIDQQIAGHLSPAQMAAIQTRLGLYNTNGRRADGQPAEFAFGKDDKTAGEQLTTEYLKSKYTAVFADLDADFAEFVKNFTGTADELLKAIAGYAATMDAVGTLGIKGLDMKALKGFQKAGEEIGATLERVAKSWGDYQAAFLTDSEKLTAMQSALQGGFAELGIAMPKSKEEFKKLVDSLDLSTESGRKLFDGLMKLAPAFATVAGATQTLRATFDQIVGSMRSGYTKDLLEKTLQTTVKQFMDANPWTRGMDWRYVAGQIRNILPEDFDQYSTANQALINTILGIIAQLDGMGESAANAAGAVSGLGGSAATAATQMASAKGDLWDYLQGLFTNPQYSPLDPMQQLGVAKRRFYEQLGLAQGGDVSAVAGLSSYIDSILSLGRGVYGSTSGYVDLFDEITGAAGDLARPGGGLELQRNLLERADRQILELQDVKAILLQIRDQDGENAMAIADATMQSGVLVSTAVVNAPAKVERR